MNKSVWQYDCDMPEFQKPEGNIKTDVLVIGGGICGLLCAYFLKKAGIDCIVAEGDKICSGITKNTTAKITSQHGLIYYKLLRKQGAEMAKMYLDANEEAIKEYKKLCRHIDCDFEKRDSYIYSLTSRAKCENEVKTLDSLGFKAGYLEKTELPFKIEAAVKFADQAQFNPLKFVAEIAKDLKIYEKLFVKDISTRGAVYDGGRINAKKIIVTSHFPFINAHGWYFLKLYQHRSYVIAYENAQKLNGMYADENLKGLSFRNYGNLLLLGGGGHRTGKNGDGWIGLDKKAKQLYPKAKEAYKWAAQDCMSLDSVPYIGRYSQSMPNVFVATGFNKWGFTSSMAAAKMLCDMVQEKENRYTPLFSPQRSIIKPQLFVNGFEAAKNLITPGTRRCPHMGCALKWNKNEHTWDCSCHGSRFDKNGKLIDNPSTKNLKDKNS